MSRAGAGDAALPPRARNFAKLSGARLCFGRPVQSAELTVIPVATVRSAGRYGPGGAPKKRDGRGAGVALAARPIGFIEIGPTGTRFQRIDAARVPLAPVAAGIVLTWLLGRVIGRRRRVALPLGSKQSAATRIARQLARSGRSHRS